MDSHILHCVLMKLLYKIISWQHASIIILFLMTNEIDIKVNQNSDSQDNLMGVKKTGQIQLLHVLII